MSKSRPSPTRRIAAAAAVGAAAVFAGTSSAARSATPLTLCVGAKPGCFASIQAAVDAAHDGDTIDIGVGTFQGGITITKSVHLVGVSAAATVISGGGPVVTIGQFEGANGGLSVSLNGLTITGGLNDTQGFADGGGVWVPLSAGEATGATVTIDSSVISANRAAPKATFSDSNPGPCDVPQDECAIGSGGGISNSGTLSLTNSLVSANVAGTPAITDYAFGGGISNSSQGTLSVLDSVVSGNQAAVSPPPGRFAEGGGIEDFGTMTIEDSRITGNSSVVVSLVPNSLLAGGGKQQADGGGVDLQSGGSATISGSRISDNTVSDFDSGGDAEALSGGVDNTFGGGTLLLTGSNVDHNSVSARVPDDSGLVADANSGGLGLTNSTTVRSSNVGGNNLSAVSATGIAFVNGGGIGDFGGQLTLEGALVTGNTAKASSDIFTLALGGGILETSLGGPQPQMTVTNSVVTANRLSGSAGQPQGGGIFNGAILGGGGPYPLTLSKTVIRGNRPDQCFGC
ncbi:MAG: hypothetical protein ACTHNB_12495 [Gaiellaceae bacterium]